MNRVTIRDVATAAGVSKATVSRVLNDSGYVTPEVRAKVLKAVDELKYQPNALARSLRRQETRTMGIIVSNVMNPFFTAVVRGIEDVAQRAQYSVILCNTDEDPAKEQKYLEILRAKRVDGLIVATTGGNDESLASLAENGPPVVLVDRRVNAGFSQVQFDTVLVDNRGGSAAAVDHLIRAGYRRIGMISGPTANTTGYERLQGYRDALEANRIAYKDELVRVGDFRGTSAVELAKDLFQGAQCDAVFAANNLILLGVLEAAAEMRLAIPDHLGVAAFDDLPWMKFCRPSLTAVEQPTYEMGATAARMLLTRISGRRRGPAEEVTLPVKLIERESSTPKLAQISRNSAG